MRRNCVFSLIMTWQWQKSVWCEVEKSCCWQSSRQWHRRQIRVTKHCSYCNKVGFTTAVSAINTHLHTCTFIHAYTDGSILYENLTLVANIIPTKVKLKLLVSCKKEGRKCVFSFSLSSSRSVHHWKTHILCHITINMQAGVSETFVKSQTQRDERTHTHNTTHTLPVHSSVGIRKHWRAEIPFPKRPRVWAVSRGRVFLWIHLAFVCSGCVVQLSVRLGKMLLFRSASLLVYWNSAAVSEHLCFCLFSSVSSSCHHPQDVLSLLPWQLVYQKL